MDSPLTESFKYPFFLKHLLVTLMTLLSSSKNTYYIYKITRDEYTTYNICVPKDQLEEFEEWKESKDILISEWVGETDDDAMCCTVFDHGYEFPDECDDPLYLEEEE